MFLLRLAVWLYTTQRSYIISQTMRAEWRDSASFSFDLNVASKLIWRRSWLIGFVPGPWCRVLTKMHNTQEVLLNTNSRASPNLLRRDRNLERPRNDLVPIFAWHLQAHCHWMIAPHRIPSLRLRSDLHYLTIVQRINNCI